MISEVVAKAAGLELTQLTKAEASLKGREEAVSIFATHEPLKLGL